MSFLISFYLCNVILIYHDLFGVIARHWQRQFCLAFLFRCKLFDIWCLILLDHLYVFTHQIYICLALISVVTESIHDVNDSWNYLWCYVV